MNYLALLRDRVFPEKVGDGEPTKPTKAAFVGSVGAAPAPVPQKKALDGSELRRLVEAVARANPAYWTPSDIEEAVGVGMNNYDDAMMTFRALATQYGVAVH